MKYFPLFWIVLLVGCGSPPSENTTDATPEAQDSIGPEILDEEYSDRTEQHFVDLFSQLNPNGKEETVLIGLEGMETQVMYWDGEGLNNHRITDYLLTPQNDGFWYGTKHYERTPSLSELQSFDYEELVMIEDNSDLESGSIDSILDVDSYAAVHFGKEPDRHQENNGDQWEDAFPPHNQQWTHETSDQVLYVSGKWVSWVSGGWEYAGGAHGVGWARYAVEEMKPGLGHQLTNIEKNNSEVIFDQIPDDSLQDLQYQLEVRYKRELFLDMGNIKELTPFEPVDEATEELDIDWEELHGPDYCFLHREMGRVYLIAQNDYDAPYAASMGDYKNSTHLVLGELNNFPKLFKGYQSPALDSTSIKARFPNAIDYLVSPGQNLLIVVNRVRQSNVELEVYHVATTGLIHSESIPSGSLRMVEWASGAYAKKWWAKSQESLP